MSKNDYFRLRLIIFESLIQTQLSLLFSMNQVNPSVYRPQKKYISSFHLVIWLFAISSQLQENDQKRIKKMYGQAEQMVKVVIKKKKVFEETINQIKKNNKDCLVKILLDQEMYSQLKQLCQQEGKISDIYLWKTTERFDEDILKRNLKMKPIKVMLTFEEALSRAERQVEKWTKPYKTFKNHNQLIDLENEQNIITINRFRYTLISFINMRISDFYQAFKGFKHLVESEIHFLEAHLSSMDSVDKAGRYQGGMANKLNDYQQAAIKYHEALQHQDNQSQKWRFYNYVMKFYQQQCFFYHIFNANLRMIGGEGSKQKNQPVYKRQELMLPFNHVYNSIKWLFMKQIQKKNKFYLQPFQTYRVYRSKVSQLNDLREKLRNMQQTEDSLFIEFYAPLSTTLSAKTAIDKFAFFPQDESEKIVVIRIKANSITKYSKFLEQNFDIFLHGFFKMSKQQNKSGLTEQQVLYNALNIFKVANIHQMKVSDLFSQSEKQHILRKQSKSNRETMKQSKYRQFQTFKRLYQSFVTVIELEFGLFYDVLIEDNQSNLGHNQRQTRKNYLTCMKKIGKYKKKFDYTDACVILNDLDQCYQILKEKIQQDKFAVSVKDGKNYFQQLAKVCRLLGRVTEAVKYTNLAIECHKQLEQVHLSDVYNTHYDKLYDMQLNAIDFYHQVSELPMAQKMLKKMMDQMKSRKFQHSKSNVRESQVLMNMGINYYSKGKLDKSISKFKECKLRLQELIRQCLDQPTPSCYVYSYLLNLVCGGSTRQCSYQKYGQKLKKDLIEQNFRRYGSREEINQSRDKANTMLNLTSDALKNLKLFFQNQLKYENLIRSNQFELNSKKKKSNNNGQELQKKIKDCITNIGKIDDSQSPQYEKLMGQLITLKEKLEKIQINFLFEVDTHIGEYIKKFLKKEPQRRIKQFNKQKKMVQQAQKEKLLQRYTRCAQNIKRNIIQLQKEGFVQSTNDVMKERNNLARVLEKSQQRQSALEEIQKILDLKVAQKDSRFLEFATAYSTKGRIQLETNQIQQAIKSFDNSLEQYQHFWRMTKEKQREIGKQIDQDPNFKQSDHDNEFQLVKIIRIKACLKNAQREAQVQKKHEILLQVQTKILQIMEIIRNRNPLQDSLELKSSLNEVHIHYKLNLIPYQQHKKEIFQLLKEMVDLNINQEVDNSLKNILILYQLISSFHSVEIFLLDLKGTTYVKMLQTAKFQCKDADVDIQWKISKALYFIQLSNKKKDAALQSLRSAINILDRLVKQNKNKKHLTSELQYLQKIEEEKKSEISNTMNTRPQSSHQTLLTNQQMQKSMVQLFPRFE